MRKYKSAYLKPYIRRAKKQDFNIANAPYFSTCLVIGLLKDYPGQVYALVQRGSNTVVSLGRSKDEIKHQISIIEFADNHKNKRFNKWCNESKHRCQKKLG